MYIFFYYSVSLGLNSTDDEAAEGDVAGGNKIIKTVLL